jgi:hypothetical protein
MPTSNVIKAVSVAIVLFLVGAVTESLITVWVFKKYGGCPFRKDLKPQQ